MSKKEQIASLIHQIRDIRVMANIAIDKLNTMIEEQAKEAKVTYYRRGQRFYIGINAKPREEYILARVGDLGSIEESECCFINVNDGRRWGQIIKVRKDRAITRHEVNLLASGGVWELIEVVTMDEPKVSDR